ncbi:hypothetical protein GG344DRAFT_67617 [Lentinula edodes]|nr:hypothetical protein GG344DRAFT_67617 [Lentinula edodes]
MQRKEEAVGVLEDDSEDEVEEDCGEDEEVLGLEDDDEDLHRNVEDEGSDNEKDEDEEDEDDDEEEDDEGEEVMMEEQKMEEGKQMFSIFYFFMKIDRRFLNEPTLYLDKEMADFGL